MGAEGRHGARLPEVADEIAGVGWPEADMRSQESGAVLVALGRALEGLGGDGCQVLHHLVTRSLRHRHDLESQREGDIRHVAPHGRWLRRPW